VKLAVVVQRYGAEIGGGSELHARYLAERLSAHATVRVLTTCARDYVSWRNDWPEGEDVVNGIPVERFRVTRERDARSFARFSQLVFEEPHSLADEVRWLESQGPVCPGLIARVRHCGDEFDFVLVFTIRYHTAYYGARAAGAKAVLVPTAERDPAIGLGLFAPVFRGVRAVMYNTLEERLVINAVSANSDVPHVVVGVGSSIPAAVQPERARARFGLRGPFLLYVGRIDANKGCQELFDDFLRYLDVSGRAIDLALIGTPVMTIPQHPRIRYLGYVSDEEKFDTLAAAEALVMPSYYESLSMVTLEAWALGRPVLANGRCDVLAGQCLRSNAGLCYENATEFAAMLDRLLDDTTLRTALGENGRRYYARHYTWEVIERKYLDMLQRLAAVPATSGIEPLPGWFFRRARSLPAAAAVVAAAPAGPVHLEPSTESLAS
jgi:glycosyltransferase involved in cell wall biosynthesis